MNGTSALAEAEVVWLTKAVLAKEAKMTITEAINEEVCLIAPPNSLLGKCLQVKPDLDEDVQRRLALLEQYDFGFLLMGLSPRRLLRDGRLFDNEQVVPLLIHFAQWDRHCRYWISEVFRQWLVFKPFEDQFEGVPDEKALAFRNYFWDKYAIPLIEEFREFVALCMIYPEEHNAPPGPVDMVWHSFILCTEKYWDFGKTIWLGASHVPPEVPEEHRR